MPYMVVWIEEAAKFFRNGTEMEGLVMEARSAGISVIISLQRPSATSMPTDVREQLGGVLCFGVKGSTTADMALPDDVRDSGARPEAWENRRPGYAYLVAPGVDEDRYPTPLRTYRIDDEQIGAALAIAPRPSADPVTAAAAGEAYANRTRHDADTALTSTDMPKVVMSKEEEMDEQDQLVSRQAERSILEAAGIDTDGLIDGDSENEIPPTNQVWQFAEPAAGQGRDLTPEEAETELLAILEEFREQGMDTVGPRHFQPFWGEGNRLPRSRAWVSGKLNDLADAGIHLAETDEIGVYRLLDPEPAGV
jgi:hypothetical protein